MKRDGTATLDQDELIALMDQLTIRAASVSDETENLQDDIDLLRQHGWLKACVPSQHGGMGLGYQDVTVKFALDFLSRLGGANLSLGRLFEGHMNACKLIVQLGAPQQSREVWEKVQQGAFLGVWGADGQHPVVLRATSASSRPVVDARLESVAHNARTVMSMPVLTEKDRADELALSGEKSFCSGLGCVDWAVVSAQSIAGLQLIFADVQDAARADKLQWRLSGMRATQSGTYNFEDLPCDRFALLGNPNAYYAEPHFLGGQWRFLALYAGALSAIAQAVSKHLRQLSRATSDAEAMRLARIVGLAHQARLWAKSISYDTELTQDRNAGIQAVIGRELVEAACIEVMTLAERIVGTRAFETGSQLERLCRDLRTYLRQAALDQRLLHAGQKLLSLSPTGQAFLAECGAERPIHWHSPSV